MVLFGCPCGVIGLQETIILIYPWRVLSLSVACLLYLSLSHSLSLSLSLLCLSSLSLSFACLPSRSLSLSLSFYISLLCLSSLSLSLSPAADPPMTRERFVRTIGGPKSHAIQLVKPATRHVDPTDVLPQLAPRWLASSRASTGRPQQLAQRTSESASTKVKLAGPPKGLQSATHCEQSASNQIIYQQISSANCRAPPGQSIRRPTHFLVASTRLVHLKVDDRSTLSDMQASSFRILEASDSSRSKHYANLMLASTKYVTPEPADLEFWSLRLKFL